MAKKEQIEGEVVAELSNKEFYDIEKAVLTEQLGKEKAAELMAENDEDVELDQDILDLLDADDSVFELEES